jgi:hypothetical protein
MSSAIHRQEYLEISREEAFVFLILLIRKVPREKARKEIRARSLQSSHAKDEARLGVISVRTEHEQEASRQLREECCPQGHSIVNYPDKNALMERAIRGSLLTH